MELTKRKQNILASIVDGYIRTGEPVGSKSIAEKAGVSSATVRNEMAELTELGLLEQPHTSAGRVPSQEGYREFVDALMQPETLTEAEKLTIDAMLAKSAFDTEYWDEDAEAAYLWNGETFISFESPEAIRRKCEYVKEKGMLGVMYWEHSADHTRELLTVIAKTLNI